MGFLEILSLCKPSIDPSGFKDLNTNFQEEIGHITPDLLVRVMTNALNRLTQCIDKGERHLHHNMIFKTVCTNTKQINKPILFIAWVLLCFEQSKLCCSIL